MLSKKTRDDIFSVLKVRDQISYHKCQEMIDKFEKEVQTTSLDKDTLFKLTFNLDPSYMDY